MEGAWSMRRTLFGVTLIVVLSLGLASCEWAMYGAGPGRSGWNAAERTIGVGNVGLLQLGFSVADDGAFVVAGGLLYVATTTGATSGEVRVYDAQARSGCSGAPVVCTPLWIASVPSSIVGGPVVADGSLFVNSALNRLNVFDATGSTGCTGIPRVCQAVWTAPALGLAPLVDGGVVYVNWNAELRAYDAAGTDGCGGSPKVCQPLWTGVVPDCNAATLCYPTDGIVAVGGRVFRALYRSYATGGTSPLQAWFDKSATTGCSGSPKTCVGTITSGGQQLAGPGGADGAIVSTFTDTSNPENELVRAYLLVGDPTGTPRWLQQVATGPPGQQALGTVGKAALDASNAYVPTGSGVQAWAVDQPPSCTASATCRPLWQTTTAANAVTIANGVVYDDAGRAFDAAGTVGCSGTPRVCSPVAQIGPPLGLGAEVEVVNGWVYRRALDGIEAYHLPS
jgi:hypothetical protein